MDLGLTWMIRMISSRDPFGGHHSTHYSPLTFWIDLWCMRGFVTSCISHLENMVYWLIYADLPNVDTFHFNNSFKIIFVSITNRVHQKNLSEERSSQAHSGRNKFSKTLSFIWELEFLSLPTNTLSCFPWCDRLTLFISKKMSAKYPSLANIIVCQLSFWVKTVFYVKGASSAFWTPTIMQGLAFPPDHH